MRRFWWVNHKQTFSQEIAGQYLWSPKSEKGGVRSEFYNNMSRAQADDLIVSYAGGQIRYVGVVAEVARTASKPKEFGTTGKYWANEGWLLPVRWTPLKPPVSPKAIINDLAPLLPVKYSPIRAATGNGNQKAYLAEISQAAFELVTASSNF